MSDTHREIEALEEQLRLAELGPDAGFFERVLADRVVLVAEDGRSTLAKAQVVAAHQPGAGPKFTRVEMRDLTIIDHGAAAVVTCRGTYHGATGSATLAFMRVWLRVGPGWQIIAGSVSTAA